MNLGQALKDLRLKQGLSQVEAASKIGMTQAYLSRIENNEKEPSTDMIKKIGSAYGSPLSIVLWMATDEVDVSENKREAFRHIKPIVDSLINQLS